MQKGFIGFQTSTLEKNRLRSLAKEDFRTLAAYMRELVRKHLEEKTNGKGPR